MEGALDAIADDFAAVAEVRAEMRAIRVEHVGLPVFASEEHHVLAEILEGHHAAGEKLVRIRHLKPTVRIARKGESTLAHRLASALFELVQK